MAKTEIGVRPLHDRILVRRMAEEDKTAGGLFIPDTAKEKPQKGIVQRWGDKVSDLKEGDKVLFRKYAGDDFPGDEELLLMDEREIIAKVEE